MIVRRNFEVFRKFVHALLSWAAIMRVHLEAKEVLQDFL